MKMYKKLALMACGVAFATSAFTMAAIGTAASAGVELPIVGNIADDINNAVYTPSDKGHTTPVSSRGAVTDFTEAADKAIHGVVSIKSYVTPRQRQMRGGGFDDFFNDPFFEFFFGPQQRRQQPVQPEQPKDEEEAQQQSGLGSGVIISEDGYIVTNNHVIDGAERLEITLNDNRTFNARVIGADKATDLALIKIDATGLDIIPLGDSDALKVGEWVLAVGNPFGFTSTVTTGIVSAKARNMAESSQGRGGMGIESYIQTDAAVNPGNSGGALVNLDGELVGINTAIYSQTGNYAGNSFAIPVSLVSKVVDDLKQYGAVQRALMGLSFQELTPKIKKDKNITATNDGLYVAKVVEGKAADKAGLKEGDVIIGINGTKISNTGQLFDRMNRFRPGDIITVTYVRDNKIDNADIELYNEQGGTSAIKAPDASSLGCEFAKVDEKTLKELGIKSGLEVKEVNDGKFKNAGIKKGFIITDINNQRVTSGEEVEKMYLSIMNQSEYDHVMFVTGMYPTGRKVYYAVDLDD